MKLAYNQSCIKKDGKWLLRERIENVYYYDMEGSIQDVVTRFQGIKLPEGFDRIELICEDRDEGEELVAYAYRDATPEEFKPFQDKEDELEKQSREWRQWQYETLKEEFDSK